MIQSFSFNGLFICFGWFINHNHIWLYSVSHFYSGRQYFVIYWTQTSSRRLMFAIKPYLDPSFYNNQTKPQQLLHSEEKFTMMWPCEPHKNFTHVNKIGLQCGVQAHLVNSGHAQKGFHLPCPRSLSTVLTYSHLLLRFTSLITGIYCFYDNF